MVIILQGTVLFLMLSLWVDLNRINAITFMKKKTHHTQSTLKKNHRLKRSKNYYRLYKYMYLQASSGARAEDMLKQLHRITEEVSLKNHLLHMSVMLTQSSDLFSAIGYLKKHIKDEDGVLFIGILETLSATGLSHDVFIRLDHMLFQKYLSQLRDETRRIKKLYFYSVLCFVITASGALLMPLLNQMFVSADMIFK